MADRRQFLKRAVAATAGAVALPSVSHVAASSSRVGAQLSPGPYGLIDDQQPDANGLLLPPGFASRVVARSGEGVGPNGHIWPIFPDGAATFADGAGGWFHAVNSEARDGVEGGVSCIHYDSAGTIVDAYSILAGTFVNCAGGPTPWGTWLSCEEFGGGRVWECDPTRPSQGVVRPALGTFQHEAVAVDPVRQQLYLTEDTGDGRLYRFTPDAYPDLSSGALEALGIGDDASLRWIPIPDPSAADRPTREQADGSRAFQGGEGIWYHEDTIWFTTKGDHSVWELDIPAQVLRRVWQGSPGGGAAGVLTHVDNITVEAGSGDLIVAEDGGNMELVLISTEGVVVPFARLVDPGHRISEMTGPVFNPDGTRLYFSSQRGPNSSGQTLGVTYEITGPFRGSGSAPEPTATPVPEPTATAVPAAEPTPVPEPTPAPTPEPQPVDPTPVPAQAEAPESTPAPTLAPVPTEPPAAALEPTPEPAAIEPDPTAPPAATPRPTDTLEGAMTINETDGDNGDGNGTLVTMLSFGGAAAIAAAAGAVVVRNRGRDREAMGALGTNPSGELPTEWPGPDPHAPPIQSSPTAPVTPSVPEPPPLPTQAHPPANAPDEAWPDVDGPTAPPPPDDPNDWPEIPDPS